MGHPSGDVSREIGADEWHAPWRIDFPADFLQLSEALAVDLDRRLGYVGEGRFVALHYESRAESVIWEDGHTYGFGAGGWCVFLDRVAPMAARQGANVGSDGGAAPVTDVLLLDRQSGSAYLATRQSARRFLAEQAQTPR
jgi:hypothetical protein